MYHELENYIRLACSAKPHQRRTWTQAISHIKAMKIPIEIVGIKASTRNRLANLVRWAHRYTPQALDNVAGLIYEEKANRESELGK